MTFSEVAKMLQIKLCIILCELWGGKLIFNEWKLLQPIALVLCSNEQIQIVTEFLSELRKQSPQWKPASVMTDNCGSEIASFHEVFHPEINENGRGISSLTNVLFWEFTINMI